MSEREGDHIPLEPSNSGAGSANSRGDLPPITTPLTTCPNCGAPMAPEAVVCLECGYDQRAGQKLRPTTGTVEVEPDDAPSAPAAEVTFVKPGGPPAKVLAIAGAVVTVIAMIAAGYFAPTGAGVGVVLALGARTVYETVLHTGTGLLALVIASRVAGERFGSVETGVARMFLAFAVFELLLRLHLPIPYQAVESGLRLILALGVYWLVLGALFRRGVQQTSIIVGCHLGVWGFVELGVLIAGFLEQASRTLPAAGG